MSKKRRPKSADLNLILAPLAVTPQDAASAQLDLAIDDQIQHSALAVQLTDKSAETISDHDPVVESSVETGEDLVCASTSALDVELSAIAVSAIRVEEMPAEVVAAEIKQTLGERFRSIRESRGASREEMARRLRVSPSVVHDIESDNWDRLGAPVYVRGHLHSYAKALEVPAVVVALALQNIDTPASLALTVSAPAPASWWSRYSSAATYTVLTLLLAIPVFTIIPKRGVNSPVPLVRSMDDSEAGPAVSAPPATPKTTAAETDFVGPPEHAAGVNMPAPAAASPDNTPLMASMTPIGSMNEATQVAPGMHRIEITFSEDSWLEIVDDAGTRLDYGIARAGERRQHEVDGTVAMSIGNVNGVKLLVDDKPVDLLQFARLNVARLKLFEPEPTSATPSR